MRWISSLIPLRIPILFCSIDLAGAFIPWFEESEFWFDSLRIRVHGVLPTGRPKHLWGQPEESNTLHTFILIFFFIYPAITRRAPCFIPCPSSFHLRHSPRRSPPLTPNQTAVEYRLMWSVVISVESVMKPESHFPFSGSRNKFSLTKITEWDLQKKTFQNVYFYQCVTCLLWFHSREYNILIRNCKKNIITM